MSMTRVGVMYSMFTNTPRRSRVISMMAPMKSEGDMMVALT